MTISLLPSKNKGQCNVNHFWACISDHLRAVEYHEEKIILSAACVVQIASKDIVPGY